MRRVESGKVSIMMAALVAWALRSTTIESLKWPCLNRETRALGPQGARMEYSEHRRGDTPPSTNCLERSSQLCGNSQRFRGLFPMCLLSHILS